MERAGSGGDLALVMSGGGARAAYQVGFLRAVARHLPSFEPDILTGVSAGAINATFLASHAGGFPAAVVDLERLWSELTPEGVMDTRTLGLGSLALRWALRLASGGRFRPKGLRGLVDTAPLRALLARTLPHDGGVLTGIQERIDAGTLQAFAVTATSYSTGQSITFCQGRAIDDWERPTRRSRRCRITLDHVMASSALPLLFPAVELPEGWFGDGGVRQTAPLSPAIHLGARRILAITTRYARSAQEADRPVISGYPPPAQVASVLLNAVFLDQLDGDALRLERTNRLLGELPGQRHGALRPVALQVWRPSANLGELANDYEARLPHMLRFLARGTGTLETRSNDLLSLIMFQRDYLQRLLALGARDAESNMHTIMPFLSGEEVRA